MKSINQIRNERTVITENTGVYTRINWKPVKKNHSDVKIQNVKKKDVRALLNFISSQERKYDIDDVDADQVTGTGNSNAGDGDIYLQGDDAGKLGMAIAKKWKVKVMGESVEVTELTGDKEAYVKFFNATLKKFGVKSASDLKGQKKLDFYNAIDSGWEGDNEED